uniref:Envelope protein n=1 Tax=Ditylenchus dipsaci TaxID=166011 RepID=A0A915CMK8_9BILA
MNILAGIQVPVIYLNLSAEVSQVLGLLNLELENANILIEKQPMATIVFGRKTEQQNNTTLNMVDMEDHIIDFSNSSMDYQLQALHFHLERSTYSSIDRSNLGNMSLDRILVSIDNLLVDISSSVNRLLNTLTIFLPVFIISFALLVLVLIALLVITLLLQLKRLREKRQNEPLVTKSQDLHFDAPKYTPTKEFDQARYVDSIRKSEGETQKSAPREYFRLKRPHNLIEN